MEQKERRLLRKAQAHPEELDYARALLIFEELLESRPNLSETYVQMGHA